MPGASPWPASPPRVQRCLLWAVTGALPQAVGSKRQPQAVRQGLVLGLRDDEGGLGLGEAAPLPGHSPDTLADCTQALSDLSKRLASSPRDAAGWPILPLLDGLPAARFAFETAFADLWAQQQRDARGQIATLAQILGGPSAPPPLVLNALVGSPEEAQAAVAAGFRTLKLKIGGPDFAAERALLLNLRATLPADVALRVDANGAYELDEATRHLRALAELGLEYVEQPVAAGNGALLRLPATAVPVAADESLQFPEERDALRVGRQAAVWVIKPALFGLRLARALATQAQAQGIGVVITHLFDGPLGLAAAVELAWSLPQPPRACGLAWHAGLAAWPPLVSSQSGALPQPASMAGWGPAVLHRDRGAGLGGVDREGFVRALGRPLHDAEIAR